MKKLILFLVIAIGSWGFYKNSNGLSEHNVASETEYQTNYECDGREYCSQMISYEEAKFIYKTALIQKWMVTTMENHVKVNLDGINNKDLSSLATF